MCKEGKQIPGHPFPETPQSDAENRCNTRQESGYKVVACYAEGREDRRPISLHSHTPEGMREAIENANSLARDASRRSHLDDTYQVDDFDFDPVVYEFSTQLREICRLTCTTEESAPDVPECVADTMDTLR